MENNKAKEVLKVIKGKGYWRVNIYPNKYDGSRFPKPLETLDFIQQNSISLRGWDYPHIPQSNGDYEAKYPVNKNYEAWVNSGIHREAWRFTSSGQLLHYYADFNDWFREDTWFGDDDFHKSIEPGKTTDILAAVFRLTEIALFAHNLLKSEQYKDGLTVEISYHNAEGRKLIILDRRRMPLFGDYICQHNDIDLGKTSFSAKSSREEMLDEAVKWMEDFFTQFSWTNMPVATFKQDQQRLIERRF